MCNGFDVILENNLNNTGFGFLFIGDKPWVLTNLARLTA